MLNAIRIPLAVLMTAALCGAVFAEEVYVKPKPAEDEVLIKTEVPGKTVIKKKTTVKKGQPVQAAQPQGGRTQINNINIQDKEAAARSREDSLALARARQDSLAMAGRAHDDSLALLDAERRLAEERSKRTEMEDQLLTTGLLVLDAVYFETARTDISINSKPYLDMLAKMLTKYPKLEIEVAGHTDHVGTESYNQRLSQGRAAAVKDYLIGAEPSLAGRLTARGYGEGMPKADNNTADGRMHNRRTELQVLNKEALQEYNRPAEQARGPDRVEF